MVKTKTRTTSSDPSCQFRNSVIGSRMQRATSAAKWSRKKPSHSQAIPFDPSSITFSTRPEWVDVWKASGSSRTCSK